MPLPDSPAQVVLSINLLFMCYMTGSYSCREDRDGTEKYSSQHRFIYLHCNGHHINDQEKCL
ncbi:hypothetical protein M758_1G164100 [Ceratodon purpureus]|uniref:Uncharacterized protein n=1 Tax=Ceratodon purpureus TaxID=3225 RepID=A0A8T0J5Y6_CERPU|nr:hypothetical protein KC19_1G168300 [Ceratodon purpureus]KAG0630237.1 hypothetical protein M758_1G164100 [Ceratodon purpureus]